ncbi:MAG TPA: hypothetical protein VHL78_08340 [Actinomycetota bacterium]|nr:hypothetical protein [Actinomycetota bacterium]
MTVLVGGVGQLYQGDLDLGRRAAERLASEDLGRDVRVEDLYFGAVAVAQLLEEVRPEALVLVGAEPRGRRPGSVERVRVRSVDLDPGEVRTAIEEAGVGYVGVELVVRVAWGLGVLPPRTVAIEAEPASSGPSAELSPEGEAALERALDAVRAEVRRVPLLDLADRLRQRLRQNERLEPSKSLETLRRLLRELDVLDGQGRWGAAFALGERLRLEIAEGAISEGMEHLDWGLWWALVEELERLEALEVLSA